MTLRSKASLAVAAPVLFARSTRALRTAAKRGLPSVEVAEFGRSAGRRVAIRRPKIALDLLLMPVSFVRYLEFDFLLRQLGASPGRCLDVSSPRLCSLFLAAQGKPESLLMINPDPSDIERTSDLARLLNLRVETAVESVAEAHARGSRFDSIWSISVVEHIHGEYDDVDAVRMLWDLVEPGGRLILTVPTDRTPRDEYRSGGYYGARDEGATFFQRFYDRSAVEERLIGQTDGELLGLEWFGERVPGRFTEYEQRGIRGGYAVTVHDPLEIVNEWQAYESWEETPGVGICGIALRKR
jgi:SAM-dependent methyltransferase